MSQVIFSNIDPTVTTGLMLASLLDDFKAAIVSGLSGTTRPTALQAGGLWVDTSLQGAPDYSWSLKLFNGTTDLTVISVNVLTGQSGFNFSEGNFTVRKVSADALGAVLNLMKARIATGGQVLADDVIAQVKFVGRTDTSTDPLVAYFQAIADENYTTTARGATFSMYSTPVGSNTIQEHIRFLQGIVETTAKLKINSLIYGQEQTAATANMVLTGDKIVTELTGTTAATIDGVVPDGNTRTKVLFNDTDKTITIKHESTAATAAQRIKLPSSEDVTVSPGGSVTLFYCSTDSRWKYLTGAIQGLQQDYEEFKGGYHEWVAPISGDIRLTAFPAEPLPRSSSRASGLGRGLGDSLISWGDNQYGQLGVGDVTARSSPVAVLGGSNLFTYGAAGPSSFGFNTDRSLYAWGRNTYGQLGVGDVVSRSSPVAVLSSLKFHWTSIGESSHAVINNGTLYSWGRNDTGQLGVGDVTPRSSPVAVLGGLKFSQVVPGQDGDYRTFGLDKTTGSLYAWGVNTNGELGLGDTTPRSSPVAVLGGLKLAKVVTSPNNTLAMDQSGALYAWGKNDIGQLGLGDVTPRSSPVAVLGGVVAKDIYSNGADSFYALTEAGTLYAWGQNDMGQLGLGDVVVRSSPVAVLGGITFKSLVDFCPGNKSAIGFAADGSLYAWGHNDVGQLGVGDTVDRSSPVAVLGGNKYSYVMPVSKGFVGYAIGSGTYGWGLNDKGQLGVKDTANKSTPTATGSILTRSGREPGSYYATVTQGTTYILNVARGVSTFAGTSLGENIEKVVIAYDN